LTKHQSLGYLLNTAARLIKRELDERLRVYGVTTSQWAVLKLLEREDNLSQAQIAARLNGDRATCGTVIEKMIKKGLLTKELSASDRRSYQVKITPAAGDIVREVSEIADRANDRALKNISDEDRVLFIRCLQMVITDLGGEVDGMES